MDAPQLISPRLLAPAGESARPTTWQVQPGWEPLLLVDGQVPLQQWLDAGQARIVKDGAHRTVYRVDLPEAAVYVKHYRCQGLLRRSRSLFRGSSARREWSKAQELVTRDLPTARPLALGEDLAAGLVGDSYLVTQAIDVSQTLDEYLAAPHKSARQRHELTRQLAKLAAALHDAGVEPDDFHGGNVLVQFEAATERSHGMPEGPSARLHLIDVPGVHLGGHPLAWRRTRRSLAMLTSGFMLRTSRADRWRFWREYCRARQATGPALGLSTADQQKSRARELFDAARQFARDLLPGRDARSFRDNRDFRAARVSGGRAHAVRELTAAAFAELVTEPAAPLRAFRHAPEKIAAGSLVVRAVLPGANGPIPVAYKRLRPTRWIDQLMRGVLRRPFRSKALRSWKLGHALAQRGIPTARPIFCRTTPTEDFLATEWVPGAENLHLFAWRIAQLPVAERDREALAAAQALGRTIGQLHWWQIRHRDLKGCNLVFSRAAESDAPAIAGYIARIIDLDGVRILKRLPYDVRIRDLMRLAVSAAAHDWVGADIRDAFLDAYLRACRPDDVPREKLARDVGTAAAQMITAFRCQGKPIA